MDTTKTATKQDLMVEYNGINYECDSTVSNLAAYDSLLFHLRDSVIKRRLALQSKILYNWLGCAISDTGKVIIVNIPSADLVVFEDGTRVFYSKVVVGKKLNPTHTVTSKLDQIILYPFWQVPSGIATKELLPRIQKDIHFIDDNGFQVYDSAGHFVDPNTINWHELTRKNFPYHIRQSTGCDNSLGILKFNFYNPFSAYLHDTPEKNLFSRTKRFYSHGCIRVEKAIDLGKYILSKTVLLSTALPRSIAY